MLDNQKTTELNWLLDLINSTFHQVFSNTLKLEFEKLSPQDQKTFKENFIKTLCQESHWLFELASMKEGFDTEYTNGEKTFQLLFKLIETKS